MINKIYRSLEKNCREDMLKKYELMNKEDLLEAVIIQEIKEAKFWLKFAGVISCFIILFIIVFIWMFLK